MILQQPQNKGYDYFTSRINTFILKGYSSIWQRVLFHILFWGAIYLLYLITILFRWPEGIPFRQQILMVVAMLPTICFFYFIFYYEKVELILPRILVGIVFFYIVTHWLHLLSFYYLILPDSTLTKLSASFAKVFNNIGYFDFWNAKVVSANLYSMINTLYPIGIKFAYDLYKSNLHRQNLQVEKTKAELNYLRNQINPHFIFNVINSAYYYVFKKDKDSAELLLKLSNIIRYTIEETDEDVIALEKEITILQDLINIEKIRSSTHAIIEYREELEVPASTVKILPLALVTLLENAIKYGVGTHEKNGFVECRLKVTNSRIDFWIRNSVNITKNENSTGIGLNNLRRRLSLVYKDQYSLTNSQNNSQYTAQLTISLS